MKLITFDDLIYNNLGLKKGSNIDTLYGKYNKIIEECFTSRFAQEKLDALWDANKIVVDHFKGLGRQLFLQDFLDLVS